MNKNIANCLLGGFLLMLIAIVPACNPLDWFRKSEKETVSEVSQPKDSGLKIVDVNEKKIYDDAHIKGAINLSYDTIEAASANWDKSSPVVTYCTTYECTESHRVAKKLEDLGFTNVRVFHGGMNEWYKQAQQNKNAYPYEGEAKEAYLTKVVNKIEGKEDGKEISAEELSKEIEEKK